MLGSSPKGLIPLEQVLDHTGQPKLKAGDTVDVVVEREEAEGGYLLSYEKAQRHKVWDVIEKAANDKTPVTGIVLGRVKGGVTVDIGIKAFCRVRSLKFARCAISMHTSASRSKFG